MNKISNVPQIRFKGFTDAWEQRKLGEIAISFSGGTPKVGESSFYGGDIPFIRSGEIGSYRTELTLSLEGLNNSSASLVEQGDILYALYGATSGEVEISKINGAINQAILAIRPHDDFDSYTIVQWLKKEKENIISTYLQGGQGNLSGAIIKNLDLVLPSKKEEQELIGKYLKMIDNLITLHQRKYDQVVNFKKAMLEKMFPKDGCEIPEIRFKDFSGEKADAWQEKSLLEESDVIGTGKSKFNLNESGPYEILGSTSVIGYDDNYDYEGDFILIARVGANAGELYRFSGKVKISDNTVFIQGNKINFIYYLLVKSNLKRLSFGTGQPLVKASELKDKVILVPQNVEEREQIGVFFDKLDKVISLYHHKLQKLNNLKKALLEKMFV